MSKRSICATCCLFTAVACGGGGDEATSTAGGPSSSGNQTASTDGGMGGNTSGVTSNAANTTDNASGATTTGEAASSDGSTTTENATSGGSTTDGSAGAGGSTTSDSTTGDTTTSTTGGDASGCRVWVAPDGNDADDGSEATPVATVHAAYDLMCPVPPSGTANGTECLGEAPRTICVKPGIYQVTERLEFRKTRMGTAENRLTLQGDPAASEKPLFDFSGQERLSCGANPDNIGGFTVNAHYVTIKNIAVRGANDNCILVQGTEGIVENVLAYECADTGIQISAGGDYQGTGTNNTIINCDSHSNYDEQCAGENADGFAIKEGTGTGNAFVGCRAWNNTDDGFDLYAWTSPVRIEDSWAFDQCATNEDTGSDCNGFKLGGDDVSAAHELIDLIAVGNTGDAGGVGFTNNSNPASMTCSGVCAAWDNDTAVESIGGISTEAIGNANVTNMASPDARAADGSLKPISDL